MKIYLMLSNIDKNILFNIKLKYKVGLFYLIVGAFIVKNRIFIYGIIL